MTKVEPTCPACGNPSRDGGLCDIDERTLAAVLAGAPDLLDELLTQTARLNVSSIGGGKTSEKPLPINLKASELAVAFENLLTQWAKTCSDPDDPPFAGGGRSSARWLAQRIYDIRLHPHAGDLVHELSRHSAACWRAVDRSGADLVYLGLCKALLPPNDQQCRTALRVKKGLKKAACWRCEAQYDAVELLAERDAEIDGSLATAREIADARFRTPDGRLITLRMIEGYAHRKTILVRLTRRNETLRRDVSLYSIREVKEAAMEAKYPRARTQQGETRKSA